MPPPRRGATPPLEAGQQHTQRPQAHPPGCRDTHRCRRRRRRRDRRRLRVVARAQSRVRARHALGAALDARRPLLRHAAPGRGAAVSVLAAAANGVWEVSLAVPWPTPGSCGADLATGGPAIFATRVRRRRHSEKLPRAQNTMIFLRDGRQLSTELVLSGRHEQHARAAV
eukprot:355465-Chlamydomonas_euryale.AAC.1